MAAFKLAKMAGYKVYEPTRGTSGSAGWDFYVPNPTSDFFQDMDSVNKANGVKVHYSEIGFDIPAHSSLLIPSGLLCKIPENTALVAFEKSGLATKQCLRPTCRVVDSDYRGEIYIGVENFGADNGFIRFGQKIVQYVLINIDTTPVTMTKSLDILIDETARGDGGFGSTGV